MISQQKPPHDDYVECARIAAKAAGVELLNAQMDGTDLVATWMGKYGGRSMRWMLEMVESLGEVRRMVYEEMIQRTSDHRDVSVLTDQQRAIYEMNGEMTEFLSRMILAGRQIVFPTIVQLSPVAGTNAATAQYQAYMQSQNVPGFATGGGVNSCHE